MEIKFANAKGEPYAFLKTEAPWSYILHSMSQDGVGAGK